MSDVLNRPPDMEKFLYKDLASVIEVVETEEDEILLDGTKETIECYIRTDISEKEFRGVYDSFLQAYHKKYGEPKHDILKRLNKLVESSVEFKKTISEKTGYIQ